MKKNILIVEDDPIVATSVKTALSSEGYSTSVVGTLTLARRRLEDAHFSLVILDLHLPDGDGLDFCKELRASDELMPILILTSQAQEEVAVKSFRLGAHEFVRKPFGAHELVARIDRILKMNNELTFDTIRVLPKQSIAEVAGKRLKLSRREFEILVLLLKSPGNSVTREKVLEALDPQAELLDRTLDSHFSRLRKKLQAAGATELRITSVYGVGYQLEKIAPVARVTKKAS